MQYYIFDEVSPNRYAPFIDLPDEIDLIETIMGKKPDFYELPIEIEAEIDDDVVYTDIINPGVPFFSSKMKSALDACGVKNIDYYPVQIIDEDTKEVQAEYYLGVVTDIIACMDLDKSVFKENLAGKPVITEFCIDESKTKGMPLFRFHNIPGLMIITEDLKEKLSQIEFEGVSFRPTQEYHRKV